MAEHPSLEGLGEAIAFSWDDGGRAGVMAAVADYLRAHGVGWFSEGLVSVGEHCFECGCRGWVQVSEHDPRCPGDEGFCTTHCPTPVQVACPGAAHQRRDAALGDPVEEPF